MRDELLHYYERELTYLRRLGGEFAERYPKIAGRLLLEPTKCEDPHVERLLEAFAFLTARIHLRLDDDLTDVSESLLSVLYPHYARPIPAMSIAQLRLDPDAGKVTTGYAVARGARLYSRPVDGVPCSFQTCYDTRVWPVTVAAAQWMAPDRLRPAVRPGDAVGALRVELRCSAEMRFDELQLDTLRLHLSGEGNLTSALYELLDNNVRQLLVREVGVPHPKMVTLPPTALTLVGFGEGEGMLPYPGRSFEAYRLLQEYFAFPEKYLFFDLAGFDAVRAAGMGNAIEVIALVRPFERTEWRPMLEAGVTTATVRVGCTPVINLFPHTAEPIRLTQQRQEHRIVPDARRRLTTEIFSVDDVVLKSIGTGELSRFEPFYGIRHGAQAAGGKLYWHSSRRPSGWRTDAGTDVFLSFVDLSGRTVHPDGDSITARLTCFNGDLPSRLPFGNERGDFELDGGGPVKQIVALLKPTRVIQPPLGKPLLWRLVSHLSLSYLSLVDGGPDALREVLRLYDFGDTPSNRKQVEGLLSVESRPAHTRIVTEHGLAFARGRRVELELDEEQFAGGGVYLFASVLDRFLGLYASMNSFTTLAARTPQRKTILRQWAPRAGWKPLL
ncbi:MAG TPA: type VI secretion system baseplate subunit TssF [Gemmatimonadaceae bacterium]|nr:type VI secretion system baseplate subunit TssF [Gemmatimonadaceae bacterium]